MQPVPVQFGPLNFGVNTGSPRSPLSRTCPARPRLIRPRWPASTWGSRPSPSCPPVRRSPTPGTWAGRCGRFAACPAPCPGGGARIGGPGSSRRTGGSASVALGKVQGRVADQRRDALHKATTDLTGRFGTLVAEDLNVAGMTRNRRLARHVADASFAGFRRQIEYKAAWRGGRVIVAGRWFASSKTCSGCGAVKTKLPLSERTYVCAACGLVADRDRNAAVNLAAYGERQLAGSGPDSNGRGADRKTTSGSLVAVKRQPGTAPAGQTGTVPPQGRTAA